MTVKALMSALTCHVAEELTSACPRYGFSQENRLLEKFNFATGTGLGIISFDGTCRTLDAAFRFAEEDSVMPKRAKKAGKK